MTDLAVTLHLSDRARAHLADQAAARGEDVSAYASRLVERAVDGSTRDEGLAPRGQEGDGTEITAEDLEFFRAEIAAHRREKRLARDAEAGRP